MEFQYVDQILAEYEATRDPVCNSEPETLKAAMFVESAFGIQLSDAEIDPRLLGDAGAMRALVLRKLGVA